MHVYKSTRDSKQAHLLAHMHTFNVYMSNRWTPLSKPRRLLVCLPAWFILVTSSLGVTDCSADVIVVIDRSSSIKRSYDDVLAFVKLIVGSLTLSPTQTRVGVVTFDKHASEQVGGTVFDSHIVSCLVCKHH